LASEDAIEITLHLGVRGLTADLAAGWVWVGEFSK
jgi:hypothetical protein